MSAISEQPTLVSEAGLFRAISAGRHRFPSGHECSQLGIIQTFMSLQGPEPSRLRGRVHNLPSRKGLGGGRPFHVSPSVPGARLAHSGAGVCVPYRGRESWRPCAGAALNRRMSGNSRGPQETICVHGRTRSSRTLGVHQGANGAVVLGADSPGDPDVAVVTGMASRKARSQSRSGKRLRVLEDIRQGGWTSFCKHARRSEASL
jgi:hypothetical protein